MPDAVSGASPLGWQPQQTLGAALNETLAWYREFLGLIPILIGFSRMYVSRGIGTSSFNVRFLCRPELAFITVGR